MNRLAPIALATALCFGPLGCEKKDADTPTDKKPATGAGTQGQAATGAAATGAASQPAAAPAAKADRKVMFAWPQDGATVFETFPIVFAAQNVEVVPAGTEPDNPNKGHHHLVIDGKAIPAKTMVPKDDKNIHFGKGQTQTMQTLAPGKHTLTMQFADGAHRSYGEALSSTINVTVVKAKKPPKVFFVSPKDGAVIKKKSKIKFGVEGFALQPAGEDVLNKTTGHHHLIIDDKPVPAGTMVGKDATHIHFGKAQTETEIELAPGKHTLTLQLADGAHMSYGPAMSATITVEVK